MAELTAKDEADLATMFGEQPKPTNQDLKDAPTGTRAADSQGDLWTKQWQGMWKYRNGHDSVEMTTDALVHVWGPIRMLPEGGLS